MAISRQPGGLIDAIFVFLVFMFAAPLIGGLAASVIGSLVECLGPDCDISLESGDLMLELLVIVVSSLAVGVVPAALVGLWFAIRTFSGAAFSYLESAIVGCAVTAIMLVFVGFDDFPSKLDATQFSVVLLALGAASSVGATWLCRVLAFVGIPESQS